MLLTVFTFHNSDVQKSESIQFMFEKLIFLVIALSSRCSLSVVGGSCSPVGYYEPILVAVAFKGGM